MSRRRLLGTAAMAALLAAGGCGDSGGANQIDAPPTDKIGNRSKLKEFGEKAEAAKSLKSNKRR